MATVKSAAEIEEEILGKWRTVQTEGIPQLREVFNIDESVVPDNPRGEIDISKDSEGVYIIVNRSEWGTKRLRVELGKPTKDTVMGREIDMVTIWEGPRLATKVVGTKDNMVTREVVDGRLVSVVHINDFVITSIAEKY
ncbi:uncharacterized protein LOC119742392 [Patiria miniata]|uniref:Uncharacterized protein n=1 Tax=Patiria miniata TaxID=46514 RepID=A0A914BE06_PATMI|nr:uncharacterized protein LOC119742392 [Patiria miniata]XP_038074217.1 uncharacterized protein LOC119742392 [Patiria miniata]